MDDQFGGRTDDALFDDDFEPIAPESQPVVEQPHAAPEAEVASQPVAPPHQPQRESKSLPPPKTLAQSRHNPNNPAYSANASNLPNNRSSPRPNHRQQRQERQGGDNRARGRSPREKKDKPAAAPAAAANVPDTTTSADTDSVGVDESTTSPPKPAPTGPASSTPQGGGVGSGDGNTRLLSGANPRTKLTESQLAAKMEEMRILAAEKTKKFEEAEQDERQHAAAYAKGMEEARRRRAAEAERRRRGEEERRKMEEERARNRERKLKAFEGRAAKEGNWDEGKDALALQGGGGDARRGFRSANGGVRGAKTLTGLAGSRFASQEPEESGDGRGRGRGGRGRGGFGRGGRGGRGGHGDAGAAESGRDSGRAHTPVPPKAEDFPALPGEKKPPAAKPEPAAKADIAYNAVAAQADRVDLPMASPVGRWDDEMEAFDERMAKNT